MAKKLFVEVCNASDLMPKDGEGSVSAYCVVDYDGHRRRTEPKSKDLNPTWNCILEFELDENSSPLENNVIEINVMCDKKAGGKQRPLFLGRTRIPGRSVVKRGEEAVVYHQLSKRSLFSHVKGELGVKVWWDDPPPPPPPPAAEEPPKDGEAAPAPPEPAAAPESKEDGGGGGGGDEKKEDSGGGGGGGEEKKEIVAAEENSGDAGGGAEEKKEEAAAPTADSAAAAATAAPPPESTAAAAAADAPAAAADAPAAAADAPAAAAAAVPAASVDVVKKDESTAAPPAEIIVQKKSKAMEFPAVPRPTIVPPAEYTLKETKPLLSTSIGEKVVTFDLVEKMQYLFVRVVKARGLLSRGDESGASCDPFVKISLGSHIARTRAAPKTLFPEWNEVFAFGKERMGGPALEVSLWDEASAGDGSSADHYLGSAIFDFAEIPTRIPPDSPLAPQWYRLDSSRAAASGRIRGDLMLSVWLGTQADEAFTEAWQSDSGGYAHTRSKVYLSPKLWYLRVNVIEAQEVGTRSLVPDVSVRVQLGFQVQRTRASSNRNSSPFWNEDLLFVAGEPFEEDLLMQVEERIDKEDAILGHIRIPLSTVDRRIDHRQVSSRWYNLGMIVIDDQQQELKKFHGRLHLRVCFDGGYHVMDEPVNQLSCTKPTAKQLWRQGIGVLELGILRGKDVLPMKNKDGRGTTDAYVVAKYGTKWVRTRTIIDSLNPRWNEQYRWDVHDPCTVLTVAVMDNCQLLENGGRDKRIGKVRIRLSTLESERVYTNRYPLLSLQQSGVKKLGEIELAVRYSNASLLNTVGQYFSPLLPRMHYLHPLGVTQAEILRISAMRIVAVRLSRSEPPLRQEVVQYLLDTDVNAWSLRRSKVNYFRLMNVLSGPLAVARWLQNICQWKNPITTVLVHILFLILVWYPELVFPTLFLYMFLIGLWQYRYRPRSPPSMEARLSQAESVEPDELDEEFDPIPSSKDPNIIRARYDRVRIVAARIQNVLGDLATQGERVGALLSWRDPRATAIFVVFSLVVAVVLYVVPFRVVVVLAGLYALRHPRFRDPLPPAPLSFFRRLPSLADRIL